MKYLFKKGNTYSKNRLGKKSTEEHKKKISQALKGKKPSNESRKKMSESAKKRKATPDTRRKMSEAMKGAKCHLWRGGITPINRHIRTTVEYKIWRQSVFERDNYTCIWCGARSGKGNKVILNADHIKPFAYYPELRFAIDNGRTLCEPCHKLTDTYKQKK